MNTYLKGLMVIAAVSLPGTAFAQTNDAAYCKALAVKYEHYLDSGMRLGQQPQSLESRISLEQCQAGDARGIPGLERALTDAQLTLPSRAEASAPNAKATAQCGIETWSTDKMMYVGVPCEGPNTYERGSQ
jgi:hypothetical protein